jgi:archaellum component FlaC
MKVDEKLESHLATLLEGYENNAQQVAQFIDQTNQQLEGARENLQQTQDKIVELKAILGLEDEVVEETMEASE